MKTFLHAAAEVNRRGPVADLIEAERERPDALLLKWADGDWSVSEFAAAARACAMVLKGTGVRQGDRVAIVSGNSERRLAWQFGIYWIGAVEVSVNSELRGAMLKHCLEDSDPGMLIVEPEFDEFVAEFVEGVPRLGADTEIPQVTPSDSIELDRFYQEIDAASMSTILYTSGTTGPSKGVMLPQAYFSNFGAVFGAVLEMRPSDVGYFTLPFFHVDFHIVLTAAIQRGSAIAFNRRFSVSRFWEEATRFDASWVFVIGALLSALQTRQVPETEHRVARFIGAPIPESSREFFGAAGISIQAFYGQTECDGPTFETVEHRRNGSAGVACAGIDVQIQSLEGRVLGVDEVGEIVLRPLYPNMLAIGYWRRPEATLETRTHPWHHTGDLGRLDPDGFLFYEGRLSDSLRRRGENVSAYELEAVVRDAPHLLECAAISVVDQLGGEDEIKIVARVESRFEAEAFFEFCLEKLPRFALPRYVEIVPDGTFHYSVGTGVIQKHRLSKETEGETIYDRVHVLGESR